MAATRGCGRAQVSTPATRSGTGSFSLWILMKEKEDGCGRCAKPRTLRFCKLLWARCLRPWERRRPWPPALAQATVRWGCTGGGLSRGVKAPRLCPSDPGDHPVPGVVSRSRPAPSVDRAARPDGTVSGPSPTEGDGTHRGQPSDRRGTRCPRPAQVPSAAVPVRRPPSWSSTAGRASCAPVVDGRDVAARSGRKPITAIGAAGGLGVSPAGGQAPATPSCGSMPPVAECFRRRDRWRQTGGRGPG